MDANEKQNLRATSIIECIMQVADFGHKLQSFQTYSIWNERHFQEMLEAYHARSLEVNPAVHWYKSELDSFDKLLIPLLSRLIATGVFGGSGRSFLTQASENRNAWKANGEAMVQDMENRFSRRVVAVQEETIHFS